MRLLSMNGGIGPPKGLVWAADVGGEWAPDRRELTLCSVMASGRSVLALDSIMMGFGIVSNGALDDEAVAL